jgi:hypothetical protein
VGSGGRYTQQPLLGRLPVSLTTPQPRSVQAISVHVTTKLVTPPTQRCRGHPASMSASRKRPQEVLPIALELHKLRRGSDWVAWAFVRVKLQRLPPVGAAYVALGCGTLVDPQAFSGGA